MVASPNYMFGIYDGDNSGGTAAPGFIPPGSAQIEDVFERLLRRAAASLRRTASSPAAPTTARSSRSASRPAACSPAPRCAKTAAEAALYGGVAGAAYDPCYHAPCDNLTGAGQDAALYDQLREDYDLVGNINVARAGRQLRRHRHRGAHVRLRHVDRQRRGGQARQEQGLFKPGRDRLSAAFAVRRARRGRAGGGLSR